jgi:hypothetical protein
VGSGGAPAAAPARAAAASSSKSIEDARGGRGTPAASSRSWADFAHAKLYHGWKRAKKIKNELAYLLNMVTEG